MQEYLVSIIEIMAYEMKSANLNQQMSHCLDDPTISTSNSESVIKQIIGQEDKIKQHVDAIHSNLTQDETLLVDHLNDYTEEPYNIIESYFEGKHLERLVRHQIESYNNFVNYQIQRTIEMFNPVHIKSENDYVQAVSYTHLTLPTIYSV